MGVLSAVRSMVGAEQIPIHQIGADVAFKQAQVRRLVQGAAAGQAGAVVNDDVCLLHAGVLQMLGRGVQPGNSGVHKKGIHVLLDFDQIQGVGHDLDVWPLRQGLQGLREVLTVVQNADQGTARVCLGQRVKQVETLAFAIVHDRIRKNAAVTPMGEEGLEDPALHHALDRAHGQTQGFGRLAGADINLWILGIV